LLLLLLLLVLVLYLGLLLLLLPHQSLLTLLRRCNAAICASAYGKHYHHLATPLTPAATPAATRTRTRRIVRGSRCWNG
jgi:hypothetical protein